MPHIHDKIDFTVEAFIVHENKVLLRKHDKYKLWLSVGGHIELDEDPIEAIIREVKEEVGLNVELFNESPVPEKQEKDFKEIISPQFTYRHRVNENHEHVSFVYFAKSKTNQLNLSEKEKTDGCKWFSKEELNDSDYGIMERIKVYAQTALEKVGDKST
jgi:8-oxo-dGTP diphosphatase